MSRIELVDMEFFARHGCFEEEQIIGNKFIVNLWVEYDCTRPSETDFTNSDGISPIFVTSVFQL